MTSGWLGWIRKKIILKQNTKTVDDSTAFFKEILPPNYSPIY